MSDAGNITKPLNECYWDWMVRSIGPEGVKLPYGMVLTPADTLTMVALAMDTVAQSYHAMFANILDQQAKEAIFALDRYTLPGQGTRYGDLLAGFHLTGGKWRPFIIEYQLEPRIVEPINYDHILWNRMLTEEMVDAALELASGGEHG